MLDWAPVLTGLWAEHATLDAPARRRRWSLAVMTRDGLVRRDGSVSLKTGRQQITDLWTAWSTNQTVALKDIDFDSDPVTRQVRIIDIEELVANPADASRRLSEASVRLSW